MANCLVTGGAGFIGSHLVDELVRDGHSVRVVDNLSTGSLENLEAVKDRIEFVEGDICNPGLLRRLSRDVEIVFHLAAFTSVARSVDDPIEAHRVCATGTMQVLSAALECNVRRVVYASSSSVYGAPLGVAQQENAATAPISPYAVAKLVGEQYCRLFSNAYGLETVVLRYFPVFGPRQRAGGPYGGMIPQFIDAMLDGDRPILFGDGTQAQDFTFVGDTVRATRLAAFASAAVGRVFNIGSGYSNSLVDLVADLNVILGSAIVPGFVAPRLVDFLQGPADTAHARSELKYEPITNFADGLRQCVDYHRRRRRAISLPELPLPKSFSSECLVTC